jgi:gas vesicle protein
MAPIAAPTAATRGSALNTHRQEEHKMYERQEEPNAGFAAGLITGAIVGAGLALLLAPKSGAALRDELGESWISLREAVGRRYRDLAERAGVELDDLQARIDQTADAVESSSSRLVEAAAREARQAWSDRTRNDA